MGRYNFKEYMSISILGYNKTVIINIFVAKARLFYYNTDKDKEY